MSFFRRITVNLTSFFDEVRDYEADVTATLRDVEQGSIRIRAQRSAVQRRLHATEQRGSEARRQEALWRERARRTRDQHEQALECVRRAKAARTQADAYAEQQQTQARLLEQLVADEQTVERNLTELRQRQAALVSREARAHAVRALEGENAGHLASALDRWQARIEESEAYHAPAPPPCDPFARALQDQEDRAALEQELAALLHTEAPHDPA